MATDDTENGPQLDPLPEDWDRALAIVAHPDDMEYGAAAAVARWTAAGKTVAYVLVTKGEAGISTMAPEECAPLRMEEQRRSCAAVGVTDLSFLDHPDGLVEANLELRADLAEAIRAHRPEVILSINFRESFGLPGWNHADHRHVGVAVLDAVRDAANPWVFTDRGQPWEGARFAAFGGSPQATHWVDTTATHAAGMASLAEHRAYLEHVDEAPGATEDWLTQRAVDQGALFGVGHATVFELVPL
ncbi:MAG: PIG-L family deacetylase [Candidatus Microthrix sp.]|nr:PIG-L family deacetylase [Candidatus Microthrix sp.]